MGSVVRANANNSSSLEGLLECLESHSEPSIPISAVLYTPENSSYSYVLQSYIRNLRFNESTTPKPQLILTASHVSHIQAAIVSAKIHGLQMKIRSGGHDYEGVSYVSDVPFFILDMFNFRSINVNIENETVWVQTGATLGEVFYRIAEKSNVHGFPAGVCPTVGVGGHFGGGGYGNLMRKYGLSIDNIIDAQIIDVNGRILDRASMGEDLFWAITGGGGSSFGVVQARSLQYATNWEENGVEAEEKYIDLTRKLYAFMTPFVSKSPRGSFLNYRDLDLGINHNGKNSYLEGTVYGIKYFKENFHRLVKIKTKVDPNNFFRNEQSIPVLPYQKL